MDQELGVSDPAMVGCLATVSLRLKNNRIANSLGAWHGISRQKQVVAERAAAIE
jgi:hypothetical protein